MKNAFITRLFAFWLFTFVSVISLFANDNTKIAHQLLQRIAPEFSSSIVFKQVENGETDEFQLKSVENKIIISGNSANSMAMGLNHYLRYYCNVFISWNRFDKIVLPDALTRVTEKISVKAKVNHRFFLNYCTFGYTMPWWKWEDWEHFIDWMALNGINMPLAITGQESIWYRVWRKLGLKDEEIRNYFTGPAHLPWHRMTNIDYFQGGLPHSWLESQEKLQEKIVRRERELGMKPILPAFAGHVPQEIKRLFPESKITKMSSWGGFNEKYRSYFLDPLDPLFAKIQELFLKEQTRLFGTDHIYGADPFNEIDSPSWEPEYLATVSETIYSTMRKVDKDAQWLQMTWLFYFDRKHWTNERIDAFVNAVPKNNMILLDYFAENTEIWKMTNGYFGQPFIWCYLGNFGGNTMLVGNLREVGKRIDFALQTAGDNFSGIGSTLEAFDVNPFMYEYVFEKAWDFNFSDDEWISRWADRRVGNKNSKAREAWIDLINKVYISTARLGQATLTNARPSLYGSGNWTTNPKISYNNLTLFYIWKKMLSIPNVKSHTPYHFDVANIGRQVLGNYFHAVRDEFTKAYEDKNALELERLGHLMIDILVDLDRLLATTPYFSFDDWVNNAAKYGINKTEKEYFKRNARTLLTTWGERGQSLNDYASRTWSGLISVYYLPRWQKFVDQVIYCVKNKIEFNQDDFNNHIKDFEISFALDGTNIQAPSTKMNAKEMAKELLKKYETLILEQYN